MKTEQEKLAQDEIRQQDDEKEKLLRDSKYNEILNDQRFESWGKVAKWYFQKRNYIVYKMACDKAIAKAIEYKLDFKSYKFLYELQMESVTCQTEIYQKVKINR